MSVEVWAYGRVEVEQPAAYVHASRPPHVQTYAPMRSIPPLAFALVLAACDGGAPDTDDPPGADAVALFPVERDGRWGFMDASGALVIPAEYDAAREFSEGLVGAREWRNGRHVWDYLRPDGRVAFTVEAWEAYPVHDGLARVNADGRWGFVDTTGAFVVNPFMNDARDFSEDLARVKTTGWRWGFMDPSGQLAIDAEYDHVEDFSDGRALFEDDAQFGYLASDGSVAIGAQFDQARSFADGLAAVKVGDRWGYVSTDGRFVIQPRFISAGDFGENLAPVRTENQWEYVDRAGTRVIAPAFEEARAFADGRAAVAVLTNGVPLWTFARPDGSLVRTAEFDEVGDFEGGLARVRVGERFGYVNAEGQYVWYPQD